MQNMRTCMYSERAHNSKQENDEWQNMCEAHVSVLTKYVRYNLSMKCPDATTIQL